MSLMWIWLRGSFFFKYTFTFCLCCSNFSMDHPGVYSALGFLCTISLNTTFYKPNLSSSSLIAKMPFAMRIRLVSHRCLQYDENTIKYVLISSQKYSRILFVVWPPIPQNLTSPGTFRKPWNWFCSLAM